MCLTFLLHITCSEFVGTPSWGSFSSAAQGSRLCRRAWRQDYLAVSGGCTNSLSIAFTLQAMRSGVWVASEPDPHTQRGSGSETSRCERLGARLKVRGSPDSCISVDLYWSILGSCCAHPNLGMGQTGCKLVRWFNTGHVLICLMLI